MSDRSQFKEGYKIPVTNLDFPGKRSELPAEATEERIPSDSGGAQDYRAADKLKGKKAVIAGGDSGIGRATAVLFAREGAGVLIAYLPDEGKDAQDTEKRIEEIGRRCHALAVDLTERANCKKVVDTATSSDLIRVSYRSKVVL